MGGVRGPDAHPWTLAVLRHPTRFEPIGTAVAIGPRLVLTCAHVVADRLDDPGETAVVEPLWVAFPQVASAWKQRRRVERVEFDADDPQTADVAVLYLADDVPAGVEPARLRLLEPAALRDRRWWAFGFPVSSPRNGNDASGTVGAALANGWVRLDTESRFPVERGFSGGGLWLPDYQAVAGIVGKALTGGRQEGDAQALTLAQADVFLPSAKLRVVAGWSAPDAGAAAMAAWGWRLDGDPEAGRHWRPRGRGVMSEHERGYRFTGRTAALRRIVAWLERPAPDARVLVVTGSPGVGKSAVLGRIVTTADEALRARLPASDAAVRAPVGSIGCAVHVKGKTALDVAVEIARAVGVPLPARVEDLPGLVGDRLASEAGHRLNIVVDAVDEATGPAEARLVLTGVVLPLVQACGDAGLQVICGSRRADGAGELLSVLAGAASELDLDDPGYFELADLETYTEASLRLVGAERPGNPYADPAVAGPVAARIAALAERNFLIAGLEARRRGLYDTAAADPAAVALTATVDATLHAYVDRLPGVSGVPARDVLTALAYAEAPGWSSRLWQAATVALGCPVSEPELDRFARTAAAAFLVETTTPDMQTSTFRLFHQALNDALLRPRGPGGVRADEQRLTRAFHALGAGTGWTAADPYLLRSLSGHADRAGLIDLLLTDDDYLLRADLLRVLRPAGRARTEAARLRARLLHLTLPAVTAGPAERAAMFSVTQVLERLPAIGPEVAAPYRGRWAAARPRTELRQLTGHTGWVTAVCALRLDGRAVLATASSDQTVRIWDPATGAQLRRLTGHTGWVRAACALDLDGRALLATGGEDNTVRIWDPATGAEVRRLDGHTDPVRAVSAFVMDGGPLLATGGEDNTVRIWDPATGAEVRRLDGHTGRVRGVSTFELDSRTLLATGADDGTVRIWDPATGTELRRFTGHTGWVDAVGIIAVDGRTVLATGGNGDTRLWDFGTGAALRRLADHTDWVTGIHAFPLDGRTVLATGGRDDAVRLFDPATGADLGRFTGHTGGIHAICTVEVDGRMLLVTGGGDDTARLWDPATGAEPGRVAGPAGPVRAVCAFELDGRALIGTGDDDGTVRLWNPGDGGEVRRIAGDTGGVSAMCAIDVGGRTRLAIGGAGAVRLCDPATGIELRRLPGGGAALCAIDVAGQRLLATGDGDGTVRLYDPITGAELRRVATGAGGIGAMCAIEVGRRMVLCTGGTDKTVRLWDPASGTELRQFTGHTGRISAMTMIEVDHRQVLAVGSHDLTVRLWDPATGDALRQFGDHTNFVSAVCAVELDGRTLLATGGYDDTVRLYDPGSGRRVAAIRVHHRVAACCWVDGALVVGLSSGLLVVDVTAEAGRGSVAGR